MSSLTRKQVMWNGVLEKGNKNILRVGIKKYRITNDFSKKVRLKNRIIGLMTAVFTFFYLFSIEKYREIPLEGNNELLLQGLNLTFIFLFSIVSSFIIISLLILPKNMEQYIQEVGEEGLN